VVIGLSSESLKIKDYDCVDISPNLILVQPLDPVWAGPRLIPLAIPVPSNGMRWLVGDREWSGFVGGGRLVEIGHDWVSPVFRVC
jgi:hypothetical protein